ncbi:heterokaryon incompatibility protein-domain-containing protein [Parachaetomium inaequale]|uniref:Heterokaryon incompatibility protein-domain-containing protein n=1 Tax=Parachaetomium inaequale TaxID=2588326 RepID=A0AAN6PCW1_9PEZI|nr:heterokaryon incompatibility protein-domain-containing protein [Parachaetomium inaequale]
MENGPSTPDLQSGAARHQPSSGSQEFPPRPEALVRTNTSVPLRVEQLAAIMASPASSMPAEAAQNLVRINQTVVCPVCRNLDPHQIVLDNGASVSRQSWADREYNMAAGVPAGRITVENSKTLLDSAQRGCLYCIAVQSALGAVHPGWETEPHSFLHIFLARGLPVVVRLKFGSTFNRAMGGPGTIRDLGLELPEGELMGFNIEVSTTPDKPAIDVEIFRPVTDPDQATVGDVVLAKLVEHMGTGVEISAHAGDPECFGFIKNNVTRCMNEHDCDRDGPLPLLPDRVIWVEAGNATRIQLVEPKNVRAKYIALSYCWGPRGPETYLTDTSTFAARKAEIRFEDLPVLFQDVVKCARALGIEYIWADRLCIIQGDEEDFKRQAPKMGDIYGRATLTIAAASAESENDGILVDRDAAAELFYIDVDVGGVGSLTLGARRRSHRLGIEAEGGDYGKMSARAWIWQERLLAGRTVFYTRSGLKFECRRHSVWEGFGPGVSGHSWSAQLDNVSHRTWRGLVVEYTSRSITRPSDRLPAVESVMQRIAEKRGWTALSCGMWANDALVESLAWQAETDGFDHPICRMNPEHYAPTWSWASVDGPVSYVSAGGLAGFEADDPLIYDLEIQDVDNTAGRIRVRGASILVNLACQVDFYERDDETTERKAKYHYNVSSSLANPFPMTPDVHLKPWYRWLDGVDGQVGRVLRTTLRVPYGENTPRNSWNSTCRCLLLGSMKWRSLVLFISASPRVSGAWERLGIASTNRVPRAVFQGASRDFFDIV